MSKIAEKYQALVRFRRSNRILLTLFLLLVISIVIIGLDDLPGYILGYVATTVLFFLMIRKWRSFKRFLLLLVFSVVGIIFLSFLYVEIITRLATWIGGAGVLRSTGFRIVEMAITYIILFGGAVGLILGFFGMVITGIFRLIPDKNREGVAGNT